MNPAITTHGLARRFGRSEAVHDVSLSVEAGSIYGFLGPNGAGKTTTIKLLMNILEPSRGDATVLGVDSRKLAPADFARIGYVSENQKLLSWMTVPRFLRYCRGFYPTWDEGLEQDLLRRLDLPAKKRLKSLSRGMRMKAALVSSIAYRPKLLVLDEPFSGLDPLVRDELMDCILGMSAETDWTVFISSHDLAEIESVASHIGYIDQGRLRFSEELPSLQARFREVQITGVPHREALWPSSWMRPATAGTVTRFVVSRYSEETSPAEIRAAFPDCSTWEARPMSLREIFVAIAGNREGGAA
jgi:ABC-2 type transport system ATP-binding protein